MMCRVPIRQTAGDVRRTLESLEGRRKKNSSRTQGVQKEAKKEEEGEELRRDRGTICTWACVKQKMKKRD